MTRSERPDPKAILEAARAEAVLWRLALERPDQHVRGDLEAWLARRSAHRRAWREVAALWALLDEATTTSELIRMRQAALLRMDERRRRVRRRRAFSFAAMAAIGVLAATGDMTFRPEQSTSTPRGQRQSIRLDDGSQLTLDGATLIRTRLTSTAREVELVRGQARFDVAPDASRPFRVRVGGQVVTALGTSFTVDRGAGSVAVTLLEGRVKVVPTGPRHALRREGCVVLVAGQRLLIGPERASPVVRAVGRDRAMAWETGRLVFDNEPLIEAVERVNRYSARPIRIGDPDAERVRVSGVFRAGHAPAFIEAVTSYFPLRADYERDGAIILRSAAAQ
jgi:transmembrane sensor